MSKEPITTLSNPFASLDRELDAAKSREVLKEAKTTQSRAEGTAAAAALAKTQALIREWEAKYEWVTLTRVAIFTKALCQCGGETCVFSHFMVYQENRQKRNIRRYVFSSKEVIDATFPTDVGPPEFGLQVRRVALCAECAEVRGGWASEPVIEIIVE